MPIPLTSRVTPANGLDFGLMEDTYLIGGWRVVPTKDTMLKLHDSKRRAGMIVRVMTSPPTYYELADNLQDWKSVNFGSSLSRDQLLAALRGLYKVEVASRTPGSRRDFSTVTTFHDDSCVYLGGALQSRGADYRIVTDEAGKKVYRFTDDIDAGYPVTVVGLIATAPATPL